MLATFGRPLALLGLKLPGGGGGSYGTKVDV